MNISTSDCSSGCESGWTMYFDQSSNSAGHFQRADYYRSKRANVIVVQREQDEDDEDMSKVSNASSGPRQLNDEEEEFYESRGGYFVYASEQRNASKLEKLKEYKGKQSQRNSCLDDTASSTILSISKENDQASMEHVTSFKGKSTVKKHFGFLKSSGPGKASSDKSGGIQGRSGNEKQEWGYSVSAAATISY